jgi:tetratricopeptide (TPR) repeat protein
MHRQCGLTAENAFRYKLPRVSLDRVVVTPCAEMHLLYVRRSNMAENQTPDANQAASSEGSGKSHKLRTMLLGSLILMALVVMFSVWSYVGHVAVLEIDDVTLDMAFKALDQQKYDEARDLVNRLQKKPDSVDFGGSLFVLGALKAHQADAEWSVDRQRGTHLVAARYLQKAREIGVPPERQKELLYLLGRSLIYGNQAKQGIAILSESLNDNDQPPIEVRQLLTDAYLNLPNPELDSALQNNDALLTDKQIDSELRTQALFTRVKILTRLGQLAEAQELLGKLSEEPTLRARKKLLAGQISLAIAGTMQDETSEKSAIIESTLGDLREAERLDKKKGEISRQAMVMIGQCYELRGDLLSAIEQYEAVSNRYGDTPESILATLTQARLSQRAGNFEKALVGYRTVLESVGNPLTYVSPMMNLTQLREQLLLAHAEFVRDNMYEEALGLVEHMAALFGTKTVTELRAKTHVAWGESSLAKAADAQRYNSIESLKSEGRYHFRAAGRAYQTLAELRYATRQYNDDLWAAAENYFRGQSYTHTALVLDDYLHYEVQMRRALALLRYGQAKLALGKTQEAIAALEECIEMHPRDPNIYAARVECAKAYLLASQPRKAEELLIANLTGDTLTPASNEWRDSLFLLGDQLHDAGKYTEAIVKLEEAVSRYPDAPQALLARYTIARSFQNAAEEPAEKARLAKTENERQKNRKLRDQNLEAALKTYSDVQRRITLEGRNVESELTKTLLRNCYMMQGSVLFQLRRYEEARKAYANVSTLYQHDPFVLESFVHIANCWHRLNQTLNARQTIAQAKLVLERLPADANFQQATNFSRQQWGLLLDEMAKW